jgi:hypothetical protein
MTPGFTAELALDQKFGNYRANQAGPNLSKPAMVSPSGSSGSACEEVCHEVCGYGQGCWEICRRICGGGHTEV